MARKTVKITIPDNITDLTLAATTMLARNDGAAPTLATANSAIMDIATRLGLVVTVGPSSTPTQPTPPAGTNLIPANLITPLRAMYPQLARDVAVLTALIDYTQALSTSVVTRLGIAEGQTIESANTVRSIFSRITPVLKSLLSGNENEIEGYGISVTLGATSPAPARPPKPPKP